jgi:hypothetical protein
MGITRSCIAISYRPSPEYRSNVERYGVTWTSRAEAHRLRRHFGMQAHERLTYPDVVQALVA